MIFWSNSLASIGRYKVFGTANSIDYKPIITPNFTASLTPVYVREGLSVTVNVYTSDTFGINQGGVIVQDKTITNYTANRRSPESFRAVFSASGLLNHSVKIYVTDIYGLMNVTTPLWFYVEPASAPLPTLNVVKTGSLVKIKLTFDRKMDTRIQPSATIKGTRGNSASLTGSWTSDTVWTAINFNIPSTFKSGDYTLTVVGAKDMTGHKMNPFYQYAFTK